MKVFLSISNGYRKDQKDFECSFCRYIENLGHTYTTVSCLCDKGESPITQIISTMHACDAVIALAFDRSHVYLEYQKELNLIQRLESRDQYYTSPWIHIECAIANTLGKPLLVLVPEYIKTEGLLDFSQDLYSIYYISHTSNSEGLKFSINSFDSMHELHQIINNFLSNHKPN